MDDEKRESKYPPPHPTFLKEHQEVVDQLRAERDKTKLLEEKLFQTRVSQDRLRRIVSGGATDPWSDEEHPGHVLLLLGWEHVADPDGLSWKDPVLEHNKPVYRPLTEALGLACKRLLHRFSNFPTAMDRLLGDDEDL